MEAPTSMTSSPGSMTTSTVTSPLDDERLDLRERTLNAQAGMHRRYKPYKPRVTPPALELRFASKSIGDTSYSDLTFEEVVDGRSLFIQGLSHFSDPVIRKAYITKSRFRDGILRRIALCQANIDAAETRKDVFLAMKEEAEDRLNSANVEMEWVKEVLRVRDIDSDDVAFHHAAYADELVALTIADMQLGQMASVLQEDKDKDPMDAVADDGMPQK